MSVTNDTACTPRLISKRKRRGDFCFVKTAADVRQLSRRASVSLQTCDKRKNEFLEVNFYEQNKSSDYTGFTDVSEFSSDSTKTILLENEIQKNCVCIYL